MGQALIQQLLNARHMADTGLNMGIQQKFLPQGMYSQVWKTDRGVICKAGHWVARGCVMLEDSQGTALCHKPFQVPLCPTKLSPGQWLRHPAA